MRVSQKGLYGSIRVSAGFFYIRALWFYKSFGLGGQGLGLGTQGFGLLVLGILD